MAAFGSGELMHTILRCLSKFNTSLACKSIYTFFVATENEKYIKIYFAHFSSKFPGTPTKNVKLYTFFVNITDEKCINCENGTFIHFSQFIHFSLYQSCQKT